jgi:hypothetical protein
VLKTDLFEEANGEDRILQAIFPDALFKMGIDLDESTARKARRIGGAFLCVPAGPDHTNHLAQSGIEIFGKFKVIERGG